MQKRTRKKVLMALSGGIDSAVSLHLLLKAGYEVEAAFMKNWSKTAGLKLSDCPWLQDRQDAIRVAAHFGVRIHTLDFENEYAKTVMSYFFNEYKAGRTPNPDVMCNKEIKFKLLYDWAMAHGFDYLATGHYAQIKELEARSEKREVSKKSSQSSIINPQFSLLRSRDEFKDQTYFIYNIKTKQLPHVLFPIGHLQKTQVRRLARKLKLPNAEKRESMGLCFVGKIRLKDFLEQKLKPKKGPIILVESEKLKVESNPGVMPDSDPASRKKKAQGAGFRVKSGMTDGPGVVIGEHQGLYTYTIGQRQGIKVGAGGPYYVVKKDLAKNTLYVTSDPDDPALETTEVVLHSMNWISKPEGLELKVESEKLKENRKPVHSSLSTLHFLGRYRHQGDLVPLTISQIDKEHYKVVFKKPQKAVASGQSLVLYKGNVCVGGGVIG